MLDPELVSQLLAEALSSGGRFAELFAEIRSSTSIRLDDGKIEEVVSGRDRGAGVRVFHGDAQAYAFSNRLEPNALLEAARVAAGAVRQSARVASVVDLRQGEPHRHVVDEPIQMVSVDRKVGWLREADDAARVRLVIQVVASRDGVMQTGHEGPGGLTGAELLRRFPPAQTGERAARQAVAMLDGNPSPAGEMAVVLGPGGGGILFHEACGHGLEADHVQKDASIFKGKLGQRLASSLVIGVDDGTIPSAWGSFAVDDEGTPAHRTVLFEGGELIGYLYDRFCADRDGVQSTGNGRRQSYAHLPIPRMSNSSILSGSDRADDIIASTSRGVYAKTLGGGQVNPATGDFVFGVSEGYLIEDGRITSPVRGANLIGNGPQILAAIDGVADDFETRDGVCGKEGQGAPVSNGSPTVRIARMTVGGTVA